MLRPEGARPCVLAERIKSTGPCAAASLLANLRAVALRGELLRTRKVSYTHTLQIVKLLEAGAVRLQLFCFIFLLTTCAPVAQAQSRSQGCLPNGIEESTTVNVEQRGRATGRTTVKDRLKQLKARCRGRKLVDSKGRQIYFYRLTGCWGNAPSDYQEILERQRKEISDLKKRYTLIEIPCNPSGELIP
ncbi:MAG: hypothetical protein M3362_07250 [Acidobacteriota bacterium]|nr:hypothetical protein [Acidobacteriota bacterium]